MYVVKNLAGDIISVTNEQGETLTSFAKREDAKKVRNAQSQPCVVSRGPNHPLGETFPEPNCLNAERTSKRKKRRGPAPTTLQVA